MTMVNFPDMCKNLESIILLIIRSKYIWQGCQKKRSLKHQDSLLDQIHILKILNVMRSPY